MKPVKFKTTINFHESELEVEGIYTPESSGSFYSRNGDPGNPPESAEFEIDKIFYKNIDVTQIFDSFETILSNINKSVNRTNDNNSQLKEHYYIDSIFTTIENLCIEKIKE